jgi:hypothetical protein
MRRRLALSAALWLAALAAACAGPHGRGASAPVDAVVRALERDLTQLDGRTDRAEAGLVARTAVETSRRLAEAYRIVPPALFHNLLIQAGIRERGLCYHWTEDMLKALLALRLESYALHWGVAYPGSDLREHNSVVVTARGQAFSEGLVLDPWRHAGELYWAVVGRDEYPWEELPRERW